MSACDDLVGVVLIGGESKRMGSPKALLPFKGLPLYKHAAETLQKVFKEVVLSHQSSRFDLPDQTYSVIEDSEAYGGPLTGLLSVLENIQKPVFCMPVDTPLVGEQEIYFLLEKRDKNQFCTVFYNHEKPCYEPLIGIWELSAVPVLKSNLLQGQFSFQKILNEHQIRKNLMPDTGMLRNFNTPEDWQSLNT